MVLSSASKLKTVQILKRNVNGNTPLCFIVLKCDWWRCSGESCLNHVTIQQEVTSQRQEVSRLLQQQRVGEEERHEMKKELVDLQHTLSVTSKRFEVHTRTE